MENIYNAIQNVYNMDKTTWQEVLAELYNLVSNVENKFDSFENNFGPLLGEEVIIELKKMYDNGSLGSLINNKVLKDIKTEFSKQLDTKASKDDVVKISSGTPLFATSTTGMTDTTKNYVNTTDGYLYIYSNGSWTKTTVKYQSTGIAKNSINLGHMTSDFEGLGEYINVTGTNKDGFYTKDGSFSSNAYYKSGTLTVNAGEIIEVTGEIQEKEFALVLFFNSSDKCIGYEVQGNGTLTTYKDYKVIIPEGCTKIVVNRKSAYPTFKRLTLLDFNIMKNSIDKIFNIFCKKNSDGELTIAYKYNSKYDLRQKFGKYGASKLPQLGNIYKVPNTAKNVSTDFETIGNIFYTATSDFIGPYNGLYATANGNGDMSDFYWCGGWHGTTGNSGVATAENLSYKVYCDNVELTEDVVTGCNTIKIVVINGIKAINTVKSDGSGRNVLKETITYIFENNKWLIDVKVEFLEKCSLELYYGVQAETKSHNSKALFVNDTKNKGWFNNADVNISSCVKSSKIINNTLAKSSTNDVLEMWLEPYYGIADRENIEDTEPTAIYESYNKQYFVLIKDKTFNAGSVLCYRCGYKWYYEI